jgi:hypothetical protein
MTEKTYTMPIDFDEDIDYDLDNCELIIEEVQEEPYEIVERRLTTICDKNLTWIPVPIFNEEEQIIDHIAKEIGDVSPDEFNDWMNEIFPDSKSWKDTAKLFKTKKDREVVFDLVVQEFSLRTNLFKLKKM